MHAVVHGNTLKMAAFLAPALLSTQATWADDWVGAYGGLAVGGAWTDAKWSTTQLVDPPSPFVGTGAVDASSPDTFSPSALRLGAFAGYNWQSGSWIYGVELDGAWAHGTDTHTGIPGCAIGCVPGTPGPGNDTSAVRTMWDAAIRGRVGYLVTPTLLLYGTGGIAWQSIEVSATCESTLADPVCLVEPPFGAKTQNDRFVLTGWTLGVGVEHLLTSRWMIRAEYRYADFGTASGVLFAGQPASSPGTDALHYDLAVRSHIATVGLVYKF